MKNSSISKRLASKWTRMVCPALLASALLFACKKKPEIPKEPEPPNRHGEVIGTPTVQTIGANGGTVTTPDANIKLVIPAGALKNNVNISVQEVESTLGTISVGKTYRLLPENIQFEKDVDLTINYTSEDLNGTRRELLYLAYQNAKGEWYTASKTTYDPYNNNISVKTRHFSDWTAYAYAKMIVSGKDELLVKETTKFSVVYVDPPPTTDEDWLLALLGKTVTGIVRQWAPVDETSWGKLVTDGDNATYTAPSVHRNFGHDITAYIDLSKFRTGPGRPLPPNAYSVSHMVVLLPDEYVRRGQLDFFDTIEKSFRNEEVYVVGRKASNNRSMYIFNSKQAVGNYMFGKFEDTYVRYFSYGFNYNSIYNCKYEEKYTLGSIMITKNENGYIEGKIGGSVQYTGAPCDPSQSETVRGSFRVRKE